MARQDGHNHSAHHAFRAIDLRGCRIAASLLAGFSATVVEAETLHVPSEFPTIQSAVDAASPGDEVLVASGVYEEAVYIDVPRLVLRSEAAGAAHIRHAHDVVFVEADSVSLIGLKVESTTTTFGNSALTVLLVGGFRSEQNIYRGGWPAVQIGGGKGILRSDRITEGRGGVWVRGFDCDVTFEHSVITGNHATTTGGGLELLDDGRVTLRSCEVTHNFADVVGGGFSVETTPLVQRQATLVVENCLIAGNAARSGAALAGIDMAGSFTSCTIYDNVVVPPDPFAAIFLFENSSASTQNFSLEHSIVAFNVGAAMACFGPMPPIVTCCDFFGNFDDTFCGLDGGDNFSLAPLLCDAPGGNFRLMAGSPCSPEGSPAGCGLIGAFPVGCADPVSATSWGPSRRASTMEASSGGDHAVAAELAAVSSSMSVTKAPGRREAPGHIASPRRGAREVSSLRRAGRRRDQWRAGSDRRRR